MTRNKFGQRRRSLATKRIQAGGRRRVVDDRSCKLSFGDVDGVRPSRASVECLQQSLKDEAAAASALANARSSVRDCLAAARRDGASWTAIATAVTARRETVAATILARRRAASALACRWWLARQPKPKRQG